MITVLLLLTVSLLLGINSRSIDLTLAYTQAPNDEPNYLDLCTGFSVVGESAGYVLDLKKSLNGLQLAGSTLRPYGNINFY
jgi:hypothetical protein